VGISSLSPLPLFVQQDPSWTFYFNKVFFTFDALCQALFSILFIVLGMAGPRAGGEREFAKPWCFVGAATAPTAS
jgi:hypothetical protein